MCESTRTRPRVCFLKERFDDELRRVYYYRNDPRTPQPDRCGVRMSSTALVANELYRAFLEGDKNGMLAVMHEDVEVQFLGLARFTGKAEASEFFDFAGGLLQEVHFSLHALIIDGEYAAGIWEESGTTSAGQPWTNHGVDVIHVRDSLVISLHENSDVRQVYRHFPQYPFEHRGEPGPRE